MDNFSMRTTTIKSPCNNKCIMDDKLKLCLGCLRTIEEIVTWLSLSDQEKLSILKKAEERKEK